MGRKWLNRIMTLLLSLLAAVCGAAVLGAVVFCRGREPMLVSPPEAAVRRTEELMDAVCNGDFALAQTMLYGVSGLEEGWSPNDPVTAMLWQAYVESLDYRLEGALYPSPNGVVQDVKFISMELDTVTQNLSQRAEALLAEAVAQAEDVTQLYDGNNEYREELVAQIMEQAAREALEMDVRYTYRIVPVELIYSQGQWRVIAGEEFVSAVSGELAG